MDRIGIEVVLDGGESVLQALKEIQNSANSISGKKLKLAVDNGLKEARQQIDALNNKRIDLKISKDNRIQEITRQINDITSKKHTFQMDFSNAQKGLQGLQQQVKNELISNRDYGKYTSNIHRWFSGKYGISANFNEFIPKLREFDNQLNRLGDTKRATNWGFDTVIKNIASQISWILNQMSTLRNTDITPKFNAQQIFNKVASLQSRIGGFITSLGNGLIQLTSPVERITRGLLYGVGQSALNSITEGLSGSLERYDMMETYSKIMKAMDVSEKTSKKIRDNLYEAVLGLPTGLDTIMDAQKQYFLATKGNYKDMNKASKQAAQIAIAANNAFVGGGASDEQITYGQRQIRDLLAAGKLRPTEWESLMKSMPLAISEIQKKLKVTRSDIKANKVEAEDFVNALVEVGTGDGRVAQAAQEMKHTFNAVGSNIRNALRNAGYNTILTMDKILKQGTGGDVIDNLLRIKPAIEGITKSIEKWAEAHPEQINDFFKQITSIDYVGFLKGMAKSYGTLFKTFMDIIKKLADTFGAENIAKFMVYGNVVGKILRPLGLLIKGTSFITGGLAALRILMMDTTALGKLADIKPLKKLQTFFGGFGKVAEQAKGVVAGSVSTGTALPVETAAKSIKSVATNLLSAVAPAVTVASYAGAFYAVFKVLKEMSEFDISWEKFGRMQLNMGSVALAMAEMTLVMRAISKIGGFGKITSLKGGGLALLKQSIGALSSIIAAGSFLVVAKFLGEMQKIKLNFGRIQLNIMNMALAIGEFAVLAGAVGTLMSNPAVAVVEAIGTASLVGFAGAIAIIAKAMNVVNKVKIPSKDKIDEIGTALGNINTMYDEVSKGGFLESLSRRWTSGNDAKYMKNISEMVTSLSNIVTTVEKVIKQLKATASIEGAKEAIENAKKNTKNITTIIDNLTEAIDGMIGDDSHGLNTHGEARVTSGDPLKTLKEKMDSYEATLSSVNSVFTTMQKLVKSLATIREKLLKLEQIYGTDKIAGLNTLGISEDIQAVVGVIKAIVNDGGLASLSEVTKQMDGVNIDSVTQTLGKLPDIMTKLNAVKAALTGQKWLQPTGKVPTLVEADATKAFGAQGNREYRKGQANTYGAEVQGLLDTISAVVDILERISAKLAEVPEDFGAKAQSLKTSMGYVQDTVQTTSEVSKFISENNIDTTAISTQVSDLITELTSALSGAPMMASNAMQLKIAAQSIKDAFTMLANGKLGSAQFLIDTLNKIPGAITKVTNAMRGKGATWKRELVNGFKGVKDGVLNQVRAIAQSLNNMTFTSFYYAGQSAGQQFTNGFRNTASTSDNAVVDNWQRLPVSTGGLIGKNGVQYRAKGGMLFKPKGTDTVPAMLTPGEYVMKRNAVSAFGTKFMQRINNLDLAGAIGALSMRGGQLAMAGVPTTMIDRSRNTTINNNQQVNLTNNHASQDYSQGKVSRWVRGLK